MKLFLEKAGGILGIVAVLNAPFASAAIAQDMSVEAGSAAANSNIFKPNPSNLYSNGANGSVAITGQSELSSKDLFYGVTGQTSSAGSLPATNTYEDLYGSRDQMLGQLETGTGRFNATGKLNAEASAIEILNGGKNIRSVTKDAFLEPSRDIFKDSAVGEEFGKCIIKTETGQTNYTFDAGAEETCESIALNMAPMSATRTYTGPGGRYDYVVENGVKLCKSAGGQVVVDRPETCGLLGAFNGLPYQQGGGTLEAVYCGATCVELRLGMNGTATTKSLVFKLRAGVKLSNSSVRVTGETLDLTNSGLSLNGTSLARTTNFVAMEPVNSSPTNSHTLRLTGKSAGVRTPKNGFTFNMADWNGSTGKAGVTSFWHQRSGMAIMWFQGDLRPQFPEGGRGTYMSYAIFKNGNPDTGETIEKNGCKYLRGPMTHSYTYQIARLCDVGVPHGEVQARFYINTTVFGGWSYNANRYNELKTLASQQACELVYTVNTTAKNNAGCVFSYGSSAGRNGQICGADIPVGVFDMLTDRAATKITVTPKCNFGEGTSGNDAAFTEGDTCTPLKEDSACRLVSTTCTETLEDGQCLVKEHKYSCGNSYTYTSSSVKEVNICDSQMSCFGGNCLPDTSSDGGKDLAQVAAKLAATDMIMSDMQCTATANAADMETSVKSCVLFAGEGSSCSRVTLGLSNCCKNAKGVSLVDYLKLAFSVSKLSKIVESSSLANPVTSSWVSMENMGRDSFSALTRPITETWEGIVGNTSAASKGASSLSMETVKSTITKNVAQWTSDMFGDQAANAIFTNSLGGAAFTGGQATGKIVLNSTLSSAMSAVMTGFTIYSLASALVDILFACDAKEQELQVKKALKSTHEVGTYCTKKILGKCVKKKTGYCVFNSPLSRIFNEQARLQLGIGWGPANAPNCQGITLAQFEKLDMEKIDLSEWTGMLLATGMIDGNATADIEKLTGEGSSLGRAQAELYPRENAIERNQNRLDGIDLDSLREDAAKDFGQGYTAPQ